MEYNDKEKKVEEPEPEEEDEAQTIGQGMADSDIGPGGPPVSQLSDGLGGMLLTAIGLSAQILAVIHEANPTEFGQNSAKLGVLYSIINSYPESPLNKKIPKTPHPVGFKMHIKQPRKGRK